MRCVDRGRLWSVWSQSLPIARDEALYVQIGLAILVIAAIVVAFLSARTWHWSQVVVVIGIALSTVGFFVLAAETLRINAVLRSQANQLESQLATVKAGNAALEHGTNDPAIINQLRNEPWPDGAEAPIPEDAESIPSISELNHELHLETRLRGRVWRKVMPAGINPQNGAVTINIPAPTPAGISADTVVYLFEEGEPQLPAADGTPRGPQYLGEFRVSEAAPQGATLVPVLTLDDFERRRLAASQGPWSLYEVMPVDRYAIFEGTPDDELKQKLPAQSIEEYLRHDKPANEADEEQRKAGFDENDKRLPPDQIGEAVKVLYQRRLRDYALEFDELAKRRAMLSTDLQGVILDIERLTAALASAQELQAFREDEKRRLTSDLAGVTKEREAIAAHLKLVQQQLARAKALLAETLERNRRLAEQLAARQARAAEPLGGPPSPAESRGRLALQRVN